MMPALSTENSMKAVFALALLLTSVPALAGPDDNTTATAPQQEGASASKEEKKICKREIISTSLHGSKRICLTRAEWQQRARENAGDEGGRSQNQ
jgi:hypothetical protein